MPSYDLSIDILWEFQGNIAEQRLMKIGLHTLDVGSAAPESQVSVLITNDILVRKLNARHRGLDETTDVLSFSFVHEGKYFGDVGSVFDSPKNFVLPPGQDHCLGEVIISQPQARRQAAEAGHSVDKELAILLIHGVLHLLGHDHNNPKEEAAMKSIETYVMTTF